jgi:hypothetical protein
MSDEMAAMKRVLAKRFSSSPPPPLSVVFVLSVFQNPKKVPY